MKGLLVKDLKLLKNQKQFFIVVLMIGILFLFTNEDPSGGITYVMVLSSMCMISTISYDEFENGMSYLFTLPVTRKIYVIEKYVFGIISILITMAAISVLAVGISSFRGIDYSAEEYGIVISIGFVIAIFMMALQVPVRLKFRAEKSTMAIMAIFAFAVIIGAAVVKISHAVGVDFNEVLKQIEKIQTGNMIIICAVVTLTLLIISYIISIGIIKKKEF